MHFTLNFVAFTFLAVYTNALPGGLSNDHEKRATSGPKVLISNDDGWAVRNIRAVKDALDDAGFKTLLSAPADNKSGTGSSTAPPVSLTMPCEFNTCTAGSPPEGFNKSDTSLNYVNSFPADSVKFGIQNLAPKFFNSPPDLVLCGPNEGNNLGHTVEISGTVGAAMEATLEGFPAIAYSGQDGTHIPYTTAKQGDNASKLAAASLKIAQALIKDGKPYLQPKIGLNVNYPRITSACDQGFKFVLTRISPDAKATDVFTCGSNHLPDESSVIAKTTTCQSTISVYTGSARDKVDAGQAAQAYVLERLKPILSCV